jgi:hypothetical protein
MNKYLIWNTSNIDDHCEKTEQNAVYALIAMEHNDLGSWSSEVSTDNIDEVIQMLVNESNCTYPYWVRCTDEGKPIIKVKAVLSNV